MLPAALGKIKPPAPPCLSASTPLLPSIDCNSADSHDDTFVEQRVGTYCGKNCVLLGMFTCIEKKEIRPEKQLKRSNMNLSGTLTAVAVRRVVHYICRGQPH